MRKRTLGVVLLAGLAISGSSAFTGSNAFSAGVDTQKAGYGSVTASGVAISDVDYNLLVTDASKLDSVDFYTTDDITVGYASKLTIRNGGAVVENVNCAAAVAQVTVPVTYKVSCNNTDVSLTGFDGVGLTVVSSDA
jgi:hypothetical protein